MFHIVVFLRTCPFLCSQMCFLVWWTCNSMRHKITESGRDLLRRLEVVELCPSLQSFPLELVSARLFNCCTEQLLSIWWSVQQDMRPNRQRRNTKTKRLVWKICHREVQTVVQCLPAHAVALVQNKDVFHAHASALIDSARTPNNFQPTSNEIFLFWEKWSK